METTATNKTQHEVVPFKEKLSYALTNTGQTMMYSIITSFLLLFMTDYLFISPFIAGLILMITRIFEAANDPIMGQILDKTKTKWGKCRFYMLFTPIPVAIFVILLFAPLRFQNNALQIAYASLIYLFFSMAYTANDIPYWSMSSIITTEPKQRTSIVTMTRIIGGLGSALSIGLFWTVNSLFNDKAGFDKNWSFSLAVLVFCTVGVILMLQGYFNTKERAKNTTTTTDKFFDNLKLIPKCKPLMLNLIAGALMSFVTIGTTALSTYFIKWNVKEVFSEMSSNVVMSVFTPVINILPVVAMLIGLLVAPLLIKKFEKRNILIAVCILGCVANVAFYFVGYQTNVTFILFIVGRFFAFLPLGVWSSITTFMFGDSVDHIEYHTGKRVEGTSFSLMTFISKFQNGINVAITGLILAIVSYNGGLNPDIAQQTPIVLKTIYIMVTLIPAAGYILMSIPFYFYDFNNKKHRAMLDAIALRNESVVALDDNAKIEVVDKESDAENTENGKSD